MITVAAVTSCVVLILAVVVLALAPLIWPPR